MKLLIAKIVSAIDEIDDAFKLECEGKFINSIAYCPDGFVFHKSVEDAVNEELSFKLKFKSYDLNEQPAMFRSSMKRKRLFGFKDVEFIEVEVNQKEVK